MRSETEAGLRKAAEAIAGAGAVACVGHVAPDADSLGSSLALATAARSAGKDAVASFGEPFVVPDAFSFLPLDTLVPPGDFPDRPELVVSFDAAHIARLGSLADKVARAETLIVVDHHPANSGFGDIQVVDPAAGAAGQLAYYLLQQMGWEIDGETATALLAAIVADTGRFQYSSATPELLRIGADLMERGAPHVEIGQQLFEMVPFGYLKVAAEVLARAELDVGRSLVWSVLTTSDLSAAGVRYEDTDHLIDHLRIAREAEVALLLKQVDGGFKGSLRSRGEVDVGAVAIALGGGGHHNASGFEYEGPAEGAVAAVQALLDG